MKITRVVLAIVVGMTACNSGREDAGREPPRIQAPEPSRFVGAVPLVAQPLTNPSNLKVQVLVDSSASMVGFRQDIPKILRGIDQAISYSRDVFFKLESKQVCFFNQADGLGNGLFGCRNGLEAEIPSARSFTNLDKAVAAGRDAGRLTMILTDGVPASRGGTGDCTGSGVDAGCVARAMRDAVEPRSGEPKEMVRGVWILPVVTLYDGLFFVEQPIRPQDFDLVKTRSTIQAETGTTADISGARSDRDGNLMFQYRGPRVLAVIVIGPEAAARALIQEFYVRSSFSAMERTEELSLSTYQSGTSLRPPIEIYPGYLPSPEWIECSRERVPGQRDSNVTFLPCEQVAANQFQVGCSDRRNQAPFTFRAKQVVSSVNLQMLPAFNTQVSGPAQTLTDPEWIRFGGDLKMTVVCDENRSVACGSSAGKVTWKATPDFNSTAEQFQTPQRSASTNYLAQLATDRPAEQPHRVYGLTALIQNFYRRSPPAMPLNWAALEVCQRR